jgi:hypothetical protein
MRMVSLIRKKNPLGLLNNILDGLQGQYGERGEEENLFSVVQPAELPQYGPKYPVSPFPFAYCFT